MEGKGLGGMGILALILVGWWVWSKQKPAEAMVISPEETEAREIAEAIARSKAAAISTTKATEVASIAQTTAPAASVITEIEPAIAPAPYPYPTVEARITTPRVSDVPVLIQEVVPGGTVTQVNEPYSDFEDRFADPVDAALEYHLINASNPALIDVGVAKATAESRPAPGGAAAYTPGQPTTEADLAYAKSLDISSKLQLQSTLLAAGYNAAQANSLASQALTIYEPEPEPEPAPAPEPVLAYEPGPYWGEPAPAPEPAPSPEPPPDWWAPW